MIHLSKLEFFVETTWKLWTLFKNQWFCNLFK